VVFGFRNTTEVVNRTVQNVCHNSRLLRGDVSQMRPKEKCRQPTSLVVHDLVNQLSGLIGRCELLLEKAEPGTENAKQLAQVCDLAHAAVNTVTAHRRQISEELRRNVVGFQNQEKVMGSSPRNKADPRATLTVPAAYKFSDALSDGAKG